MKKKWAQFVLQWGMIAIPLSDPNAWKELKFRKIPANTVQYKKEGIAVEVKQSASPLIYNFKGVKKISTIEAEISVSGKANFDKKEWSHFEEDSVFRLGLILEGSKKMGGVSSLFAPAWVKTLFEMAPKNSGLDKIYFLNVTHNEKLLNKTRLHPSSELIYEENVALASPEQKVIKVSKTFDKPQSVAGLWISIDGDESHSVYITNIQSIKIIEEK